MISEVQFDFFVKKLAGCFGDQAKSAFSQPRQRLIWETLKDLPYDSCEKIINAMIGTFRYAPLPKDFVDAAKAERNNLPRSETQEDTYEIQCDWCLDSTVCEARDRVTQKVHFIRCTCNLANKSQHKTLPQWIDDFNEAFQRRAIDHEEWRPRAFDSNHLIKSIHDVVEIWKRKMHQALGFWEGER